MTIANSIVHSKLDYCNSLFLSLDSTQIYRLQLIQNSLARAVIRTPRHHHITPVLKSLHSLHWLKIPERIHFKVPNLQFLAVFPAHIHSFIHSFIHSRIYIAPLQGNYSEVLPTPARSKRTVFN